MSVTIGSNYPTEVPSLSDPANIQDAFKLYHWGGTAEPTGGALTTSGGGITGALYRLKNNPTFVGDVVIGGNLTVNGDTVTVSTSNLALEDSIIYLSDTQYATDVLDIGLYGAYGTTGGSEASHKHTGLVRDASDGIWKLFSNGTEVISNVVDFAAVGLTYDTLQLGQLKPSSIVPTGTSFDLANTVATTLNIGGAAATLNIGGTGVITGSHKYSSGFTGSGTLGIFLGDGNISTGTRNINIGTGTLTNASQTIAIGTGAMSGGTHAISIGSSTSTTTVSGTINLASGSTKIGNTTLTQGGTVGITFPATAGTLALNPTTTIGDIIYASATGTPGTLSRLAGNTATQPQFLSSTGNGTANTTTAFTSSTGTGNVVLANNSSMTGLTTIQTLGAGSVFKTQSVTAKTGTNTLGASEMMNGIITHTGATSGANSTYTLPLASSMETAVTPANAINSAFEWSIINLSSVAGTTVTMTANNTTGTHGYVGVALIQPSTSARFMTVRTSASAYVTYRIA